MKFGTARFPSVYGPLERRWTLWETKQLAQGKLTMNVKITLHDGHTIIGPQTKAQRKSIRKQLGLKTSETI